MANQASQQASLLNSWTDDRLVESGAARLTTRQRELLAAFEAQQRQEELDCNDESSQGNGQTLTSRCEVTASDALERLLEPDWSANEILKMFYEERQKIIGRGDECRELLASVDNILSDLLELKNSYLLVCPASQLYSECKTIIQERSDLRETYEKINATCEKMMTALEKTHTAEPGEEQWSLFKMPDIRNQLLQVLDWFE